MNKKIVFSFLIASMVSIECSRPKLLDQVKLPEGMTTAQTLIINGTKAYVENEFSNAITPEDKFEIALLSGRADLLQSVLQKSFWQSMGITNTTNIDSLVNLEMDPQITGSKPLHIATKVAAYQRNLAEAQTNPSQKNLLSNKYEGMTKTIQILLNNNANPNAEDRKQRTPLHIACELNEYDGARILLKSKNIDPTAENAEGKTPLECLRKDTVSPEIYNDFQRDFTMSLQNIATQNKKAVEKIVATTKLSPTSIIEEPALDTSLPRYKSARNQLNQTQLDNTTSTSKKPQRKAPRPSSALVGESTPVAVTNKRPMSAASSANRVTFSQESNQRLTITKDYSGQSNAQNKDQSIQITQIESTDIQISQRPSNRSLETRYLAPTKIIKTKPRSTSSQTTPSEQSLNIGLASTSSQPNNQEPIVIISPTMTTIQSGSFTTPIKLKPIVTSEPVKSDGVLSSMYSAMFGSSQKIAPTQSTSPRTDSTGSSPAHSDTMMPEAMHTAPVTAKPLFSSGKSSAKIAVL